MERLSLLASVAAATCKECSGPTFPVPVANILNGSYYGERIEQSYTENFLGIPYAQPPTGHLRLQLPQSVNSTWSGTKNATGYGYGCVGLGEDTQIAIDNYVKYSSSVCIVRREGRDILFCWDSGSSRCVRGYKDGWNERGTAERLYPSGFCIFQDLAFPADLAFSRYSCYLQLIKVLGKVTS
ncbi:carboxylesterase family protein [Ilyonectria robusta]